MSLNLKYIIKITYSINCQFLLKNLGFFTTTIFTFLKQKYCI